MAKLHSDNELIFRLGVCNYLKAVTGDYCTHTNIMIDDGCFKTDRDQIKT